MQESGLTEITFLYLQLKGHCPVLFHPEPLQPPVEGSTQWLMA